MTLEKVFIKDDMATFVCPACGSVRRVDASRFRHIKRSVRVTRRCKCGHNHTFLLERRQFYRKAVDLPGVYVRRGETAQRPMMVKDLSRSGVKIELPPDDDGELQSGERILIEFNLDNKQRTTIKKDVYVRLVKGVVVGTEFCSRDPGNPIDKAYDLAIGFYTYS